MKTLKEIIIKEQTFIHLYFLLLLFIATFFAYERIINSDAAFYLFKLIHFEAFNIEHGRYSAFISQLFILPCIKLNLSLKSLVFIYSVSFVLLFYLVFLLIDKGLNDRKSALALIFVLVVGLAHPHYRPVSESTQGLVYALILPGILHRGIFFSKQSYHLIAKYFAALAIIVLCFFSHPITIFPLAFILVHYVLNDLSSLKKPLPWLVLITIVLIFTSKAILDSVSSYEEDKMLNINDFGEALKNFYKIYPTKYYFARLNTIYLIPAILFIITNIFYLKNKKYLKASLLILSSLTFFIIHNIIYREGGSGIELEKNYMTLNLFIFYAFFQDIYPSLKGKTYKLTALIVPLVLSTIIILSSSGTYENRIKYYDKLSTELKNSEGRKFYTESKNIDQEEVLFLWGVPFESLLYSSLEGPEHSNTIYLFEDLDKLPDYIDNPDLFLCVFFWPQWDINTLNENYFKLPSEPYKYLDPHLE